MKTQEKPIILAIDTATEACSAALAQGDKIITRFKIAPREHTKLILSMMDEVLAEANIKLAHINAIAFGRGPGAFTGVRIATGVAHGVSLSVDKKLLPISTLAAIAQQMHEEHAAKHCITAIDARMGDVYWGKYRLENGIMTLQGKEAVNKPESLLSTLDNKKWQVAGSGWDEYAEQLDIANNSQISKVDDVLPSAQYIARLAVQDWQQGKAVSAEQAQPIYLRDKVADTIAERAAAKR
ncbi:MAG: tRNA (adenosine(37)-N6)-threonylcarbamoyltransferase complex dimerization subunit type 1 TsaB [Aquificaceae bacterium]|nr:MAG: tRNA (adenosine(37)-N6)-threonylcarbamoyltransferase complex dimerization subunit type 1 TsaB [Aquificaceae bacterium]